MHPCRSLVHVNLQRVEVTRQSARFSASLTASSRYMIAPTAEEAKEQLLYQPHGEETVRDSVAKDKSMGRD